MAYEHLILQKVAEMISVGAPPGLPIGPVVSAGGGEHQRYTYGLICSHPAAGTHAVIGTILERYLRAGGPGGRLGYPTTEELGSGAVRYSRFVTHRAALVWHPTFVVHDVYGAIGDAYWASGGPAGPFGAPIADEYPDGAGRSSDFENGTIHWTAADGVLEIYTRPVAPAAGDWGGTHRRDRYAYAMVQLVERYGYPVPSAAGLLGNLWQESMVTPSRVEGANDERRPLRAMDFAHVTRDFTPPEVMNRVPGQSGPLKPGVGLAQWTYESRRRELWQHNYRGATYGAEILRSMDAQVDYLMWELRNRHEFGEVESMLRSSGTTLEAASDIVLLKFERPDPVVHNPPSSPQVQSIIQKRRGFSRDALAAYTAFTTRG